MLIAIQRKVFLLGRSHRIFSRRLLEQATGSISHVRGRCRHDGQGTGPFWRRVLADAKDAERMDWSTKPKFLEQVIAEATSEHC